MNLDDFKAHVEADRIERANKPWLIRILLNTGDFLWYRVILRIEDWPKEIKWKWQEWTRGYSECDVWGLNHFIIQKVRAPFKEFARYQAEQGHSLPPEFATDPAAWLVVLSKIEYAFDHTWMDDNDPNYDFVTRLTQEEREVHYKKVSEGFELFGKYLRDLWD